MSGIHRFGVERVVMLAMDAFENLYKFLKKTNKAVFSQTDASNLPRLSYLFSPGEVSSAEEKGFGLVHWGKKRGLVG